MLSKEPSLALVLIDQEPIRKDYIKKCKKAYKDLQKAQSEWQKYESKDLPAYEKWYYNTFGSQLTEIRETHEKAADAYQLIHEIYFYSDHFGISYYKAYCYVMDKRKNPDKYSENEWEQFRNRGYNHSKHHHEEDFDDDFYGPNFDKEEENFSDEDIEKIFENLVMSDPVMRKKCKDPKFRKKVFSDFKEEFKKFNQKQKGENIEDEIGTVGSKKEDSWEDRVKNRYRKLVRILHPDFRENKEDPELDEIWHKVQEAYQKKDIDRLDMLLAICNIKEGKFREDFSISQILDASMEYKTQLKALKKRLKLAKKDKAWGFSTLNNKNILENSIKRNLQEDLKREKGNLMEFQEILKFMSTPDSNIFYKEPRKRRRRFL
jgi:hypothetical protein